MGIRYAIASRLRDGVSRTRRFLRRRFSRVTNEAIAKALSGVIDRRRQVLLMHSSLSHCGYVVGGPAGIIDSVSPWCETLCLPFHAYCYPADRAELGPVFDPRTTPSKVGAVTNYFRGLSNIVLSIHPTHSLASSGPLASYLCEGHEHCTTPCGIGTPYEKLVQTDASILMFGCAMNAYTLFHTAEDAAACPYLYEPALYELRACDYYGRCHTVTMRRQDMRVRRRFAEMSGELGSNGLLRKAPLGTGSLLFIPSAKAAHEFVLEQLKRDPLHLVDATYRRQVRS